MNMKKQKKAELFVPKTYDLESLYDTDDNEFAGVEPALMKEVKLDFGQDDSGKEQRI